MSFLKAVISVLLLTTYLWGFGHSLIPHCQDDCAAFDHDETIHHHQHETDLHAHERGNHEHIHHENHVDNNWIDLYLCLLSEYEHHGGSSHPPKTDEENEIRILNFDFSIDYKSFDDTPLLNSQIIKTEEENKSSSFSVSSPVVNKFLCILPPSISFRGPPVYSC